MSSGVNSISVDQAAATTAELIAAITSKRIEVLGFRPIIDTTTPTYTNFWGFWNIFAMVLFFVIYPTLMIKTGRRLHGLLFGYTTKQTGISALFFERKNN